MDVHEYMLQVGKKAKLASQQTNRAETNVKDQVLLNIASEIERSQPQLLDENSKDLLNAKQNGLDAAMIDRLKLTEVSIKKMADGVKQIADLPDPVGEISNLKYRPSGIQVGQMRVPLGVVGIIYESRPNVTVDAAALCIKSGNACILRGGSESLYSNLAIAKCITTGLKKAELCTDSVQVIATTDRTAVGELIKLKDFVDVIIPRGGKGLIERVSSESKIPVIKHLDGNCHVYIDDMADTDKAIAVTLNSKTHRYGVCNAAETLLIGQNIAPSLLPNIAVKLHEAGVEIRGCPQTLDLIAGCKAASEKDWDTEFLAPILAVKIVTGIEQAITHINHHGSAHTETIVTEDYSRARRFLREVDSSSVIVNASTRFADGYEYGLGAEIGISTDKLHARGPVGLEGLTTLKYIVLGDGQTRV